LPFQRLVVGGLAIALVVLAFHTGMALVTSGLPADGFAARLLTASGLRSL
jgi:hypothetical protein